MLTRFAPSPTGFLHLGHAYAAKVAFEFAPCLLRIEDIDHTRCRAEYSVSIFQDLEWLGFKWPKNVRTQNQHRAAYCDVISRLITRGLAYPCPLTRKEIAEGIQPAAPKSHTNTDVLERIATLPKAIPFAIRLDLKKSILAVSDTLMTYDEIDKDFDSNNIQEASITTRDTRAILMDWASSSRPDPIIMRKDIGTSYHIAVTHDDAFQQITHVVRGQDLAAETPLHVLLQKLMQWPTPIYYHHALVLGEDGKKLSKSRQDITITELRKKGLTPSEVLDMATP